MKRNSIFKELASETVDEEYKCLGRDGAYKRLTVGVAL